MAGVKVAYSLTAGVIQLKSAGMHVTQVADQQDQVGLFKIHIRQLSTSSCT